MKIAFVWTNGVKDQYRFNWWNDGLREAMRILELEHEVTYHEPSEDLPEVDWIFFWEAPCTHDSEYGASYKKVMNSPQKKALLFAGGPIKYEWVKGFDHVFVESKINKDEFDKLGVRNSTAFGVNTRIFKPDESEKTYTTVTHGTCANWKRQWLAGEAMGAQALVFGRDQEHDRYPFIKAREWGAHVIDTEQSFEQANALINTARIGLNCADFWGGGQRASLEAMACGLPIIVMNDSPKNSEYVEDSELGVIVTPEAHDIIRAVDDLSKSHVDFKKECREYVLSKWSERHYAQALISGIS